MRLGWSATPPGQYPAYRPTRHHSPLAQGVRPVAPPPSSSSPQPARTAVECDGEHRRRELLDEIRGFWRCSIPRDPLYCLTRRMAYVRAVE